MLRPCGGKRISPERSASEGFRVLFHSACRLAALSLFLLPCLCLAAENSSPAPWKAVITEHPAIPPYLIAVDKSRQELAFFERRSPLRLSRLFACTTGQAIGDKRTEGDMKTPEGIYFVGYRIGTGLDFIKYGYEAYTLNYPNPIDRLRKKTGYGIWIHGRGEPLVPLQTEGCVSMNNEDLALLGKTLVPGTPVALADSFVHSPEAQKEKAAICLLLKDKVEAWAKAWSARSRGYFDFYDKNAYSLAQGEAFSAFQAQKERLFKALPWIRTTVRDIQVLQGPDYWVTWFYQDYQAPNLSTRGVRRLYWAPDGTGDFKILGMEWHPGLNTTLIASADPLLPSLESPSPVWPQGLQAAQASAPPQPVTEQPLVASAEADPLGATAPVLVAESAGQPALPAPAAAPPSPAAPSPSVKEDAPPAFSDHVENPERGAMARPSPKAFEVARKMRKSQEGAPAASSEVAISAASSDPAPASMPKGHPALGLPPALPTQGLAGSPVIDDATGRPASALLSQTVEHLPEQPVSTPSSPPKTPSPPEMASTSEIAPLPETAPPADVERSGAPWLSPPSEDGSVSLPEPTPDSAPHPASLQAAAPEPPSSPPEPAAPEALADSEKPLRDLPALVEKWRSAWESGDLDAYMKFYAPRARQGSRGNASAIRSHKERLWPQAAPASVVLMEITVSRKGPGLTAAMRQEYTDSRGKGDRGIKTLTFENINGVWLITQEDWSSLPDEARH